MTNNNQVRTPTQEEREALLVQYQRLEQNSRSMVSTHWTVVSIFIGINTALLGAVAYMLANTSSSNNIQWIVLGLGVASIIIFAKLCLWLNRVNYLVERNNDRMARIENMLGMFRDETPDSEETRKEKRQKNKWKYCPCIPSDGALPVKGIYMAFSLLWLAAVIGAFMFNC